MSFARAASFSVRTAERDICLEGHLNSQTQLAMRQSSAKAPYAALAQLVEHRIRNAGVVGSNPIGGTIYFNDLYALYVLASFGPPLHPHFDYA